LAYEEIGWDDPIGREVRYGTMKRNLIIAGVIVLIFGLSIFLSSRQAALQQKRIEIRSRHILIRADRSDPVKQAQALEKITEIRERILAGEDFAALAKQYSEDAMSAPLGGDLGFVEVDDLEEAYRDAVLKLKKGEISDIVETSYGYHIIEVLDKKEPREKR
jgi:parvulin-like peptidyl-prolyl isomerase